MGLNNFQASKEELRFPVQAALKHLNNTQLSALSALYSELIVRMEAADKKIRKKYESDLDAYTLNVTKSIKEIMAAPFAILGL